MKNAIRCCISCILPCGSLDVIRIVHANGRVEEISGTIKACDIMKAYPKHILKKPSTCSSFEEEHQGLCPKIVIVSPDTQLQRGKIYFLMPEKTRPRSSSRKKNKEGENNNNNNNNNNKSGSNNNNNNKVDVSSDKYLSDILSEKTLSSQSDRRRGRSGVWRPHLDSICETPPIEVQESSSMVNSSSGLILS